MIGEALDDSRTPKNLGSTRTLVAVFLGEVEPWKLVYSKLADSIGIHAIS